jgi:MFS family permease
VQCEAQDLRLNLIYTAAVMSLGLTTMAWGIMVDWLGPRAILPFSAILFGAGCVLFAVSDSQGLCNNRPSNSDPPLSLAHF